METILERDLSPEEEQFFRESLESWKEEVYANLLEEVEVAKEKKIEELEEANIEYREELKKSYSEKMLSGLREMREEVKAEVLSEMIASNPELQILERIKEIVAPTLNEDFSSNLYAEELQTLAEENAKLNRRIELEEGARTLAELIAPYSEQTQNILLAVIKEGSPEEVTEQFYELVESMELVEMGMKDKKDKYNSKDKYNAKDDDDEDDDDDDDDEDDMDDEDDDDDDDKKKKSKKKKKKKNSRKGMDYDDEQGDVPGEQDTGPDEYDEDTFSSYTGDDDEEDLKEETKPVGSLVGRILDLTK